MATMIAEALADLAKMRRQEDRILAELKEAREALERTEEWLRVSMIEADLKSCRAFQVATRARAVESALAMFQETGDKAPAPGVSIKMFKRLYYDVDAAKDWCMYHAPALLKVDTKAFERTAPELKCPLVEIRLDPVPTIASDLSAYLPQGPVDADH